MLLLRCVTLVRNFVFRESHITSLIFTLLIYFLKRLFEYRKALEM